MHVDQGGGGDARGESHSTLALVASQDCYENNCTAIQYIGEICRYLVNRPPGEFDHKHKVWWRGAGAGASCNGQTQAGSLHTPPPTLSPSQVTKAFGNGLRADVWAQLEPRFGVNQVCEFYGLSDDPLLLKTPD